MIAAIALIGATAMPIGRRISKNEHEVSNHLNEMLSQRVKYLLGLSKEWDTCDTMTFEKHINYDDIALICTLGDETHPDPEIDEEIRDERESELED